MRGGTSCWLLTALAGAVLVCAQAQGAYTIVNPPINEESHDRILKHVYGETFTWAPNGRDLQSANLYARRVEDTLPGFTPATATFTDTTENGYLTDAFWHANFIAARAEAKFAVHKQEFGYFTGLQGGTYQPLFTQTGWGYNVQGQATLSNFGQEAIRWARGGENRIFTSSPFDNPNQRDHLVTYLIEGLDDGLVTWMLFWEDEFPCIADYDYNDLVVQIQAVPRQGPEIENPDIPEPGMGVLLVTGALLTLGRRRR